MVSVDAVSREENFSPSGQNTRGISKGAARPVRVNSAMARITVRGICENRNSTCISFWFRNQTPSGRWSWPSAHGEHLGILCIDVQVQVFRSLGSVVNKKAHLFAASRPDAGANPDTPHQYQNPGSGNGRPALHDRVPDLLDNAEENRR